MRSSDQRGGKAQANIMLVQVFLREKGYHCFFGLAEACFVLRGGGVAAA